jgi:ATP-dependent metalloprotease FtsH
MQWVRVDELQEGEYLAVPRQVKTTDKAPLFYDFLPDDTKLSFSYGTPLGRRPRLGDMRGEMPTRYRTVDSLALGPGGFRSSSLSRVPPYLTEEVAYLCGLLAADGYFGKPDSRSIQFINTELALHEKVSAILDTQFGYEPKRHLNKKRYETILPQGTQPQQLQDCYTTFINNRLLCEALRAIDRRILELPAHLIAAWLRGMFDGDGYVRANKSTPQVTISAWKRDENLRVRAALLRVGIATSYAPAAHAGKDGNITITGLENLQTFLSAIGSFHPAKQAKLVELREMLEGRQTSASRVDCIPVGGLLREARMSVGMGQRSFARGNYVSGYERGLVTPSRTSLQNVVAESETWREEREIPPTEETAQLKDLAHSDVLWSPVRSVKPIEPVEFVYDLCLDRHHSLLANLMITHNCIVFIDEIDAVGRHRGAGLGGGHDEREQTLNQLLVEMDGFESSDGVIIMASTNRPDVLDPALLRPGRFDRRVVVSRPDVRGREGILKVHTRKIPLGEDVDISVVARSTPGFTGADLANLVNEAALNAARYNKKTVAMSDFELAKDKVLMGAERRSMVISDEEKRITAYHEAGHTLVGLKIPTADPVHKVTIIPRGMALGLTQQLPEGDRHSYTKEYLLGQIAILMGGRIAEDVFIHSITTGASNDIERATELARAMVCEYGMSELGPLTFGKKEEQIFLGREIAQHRDYSEDTAIRIDQEVKKIVQEQYDLARKIITDNSDAMERLAQALLEYETLDSVQIRRVVAGLPLDGDGGGEPSAPSGNLLPEAKEPVSSPLKPILPPITGPVTA